MSLFDLVEFKSFLEKYKLVVKRIPFHREVSTNPDKLKEYERDLISTYNDVLRYISARLSRIGADDKVYVTAELTKNKQRLKECFDRIGCKVGIPKTNNLLTLIDPNVLKVANDTARTEAGPDSDFANTRPSTSNETVNVDSDTNVNGASVSHDNFEANVNIHDGEDDSVENRGSNNTENFEETENNTDRGSGKNSDRNSGSFYHSASESDEDTMPMSIEDYLGLAARIIHANYNGNPLSLQPFIKSVKLLKSATPEEHKKLLISFIESKLEGKALDSIPAQSNSVDDIINALTAKIRPDGSKVVSGRLLALRLDWAKPHEFTQQAEELADALQRSLIIEGISQDKAIEMSVERTVEVCRGIAKTDLVKAVLASTKFESPKEVVAKLVVESSIETKEKQILAFRQQQKKGQGGYHNKNKGGGHRQGNGNYRGNNYGNKNGYNNNNNNRNGNKYGKKGNNYGGKNYNNNYNNGNNNNSNNNWRGNNGYNNERNVRYAENAGGPSQGRAQDQYYQENNQQIRVPYHQN